MIKLTTQRNSPFSLGDDPTEITIEGDGEEVVAQLLLAALLAGRFEVIQGEDELTGESYVEAS